MEFKYSDLDSCCFFFAPFPSPFPPRCKNPPRLRSSLNFPIPSCTPFLQWKITCTWAHQETYVSSFITVPVRVFIYSMYGPPKWRDHKDQCHSHVASLKPPKNFAPQFIRWAASSTESCTSKRVSPANQRTGSLTLSLLICCHIWSRNAKLVAAQRKHRWVRYGWYIHVSQVNEEKSCKHN